MIFDMAGNRGKFKGFSIKDPLNIYESAEYSQVGEFVEQSVFIERKVAMIYKAIIVAETFQFIGSLESKYILGFARISGDVVKE